MFPGAQIIAACIAGFIAVGGCVIAPNSPLGSMQPRVISQEQSRFLQDGVTTREQVLVTLGEPDYWWDGERVFAYQWSTSDVAAIYFPFSITPTGASGPLGVFSKGNYLLIEFDNSGRMQRHERKQDNALHRIPLDDLRKQWPSDQGKQ
ncbi:MAG TPA: hypothetical protein VFC46_10255 [Humisphaera sp.]|nr:hypothetical protein [Humisphaera sp.]